MKKEENRLEGQQTTSALVNLYHYCTDGVNSGIVSLKGQEALTILG